MSRQKQNHRGFSLEMFSAEEGVEKRSDKLSEILNQ